MISLISGKVVQAADWRGPETWHVLVPACICRPLHDPSGIIVCKETQFAVRAEDGKGVYTILSRHAEACYRVVLVVHGLAGQPDDFALRFARDRFLAGGFDVCRPALYSWQPDARQLHDTTLAQHAGDLSCVFGGLRAHYDEVYLVGHSYGGLAIILAALNAARAASLWDGLLSPARLWGDVLSCTPAGDPQHLLLRGALTIAIGRKMRDEGLSLTTDILRRRAAALSLPVQLIQAGNSPFADPADDYADGFSGRIDRVMIPGANHVFTNDTCINDVCDATIRWFRQVSGEP